jgi:hypothetical protein
MPRHAPRSRGIFLVPLRRFLCSARHPACPLDRAFTQGLHVRFHYLGRPLIILVIANILRSWWLSVRVSFYALPAQLDVVVLIRPIQAIATRTPDER